MDGTTRASPWGPAHWCEGNAKLHCRDRRPRRSTFSNTLDSNSLPENLLALRKYSGPSGGRSLLSLHLIGAPRGQVVRLAHHHGALPIGVRGMRNSTVGADGLLRFGHVRVLTTHRVVIHCVYAGAHAASLPRRPAFSLTSTPSFIRPNGLLRFVHTASNVVNCRGSPSSPHSLKAEAAMTQGESGR